MDALPASRVPDRRTAPPLRWGVIGTGWIAERFVAAAQKFTQQQIIGIGSRTEASAAEFARRFELPTATTHEELVTADDIDVIYVATPHNLHLPHARLALEAGKHVLVEKPLTLNVDQARELQELAARRDLLCAEAMWTLFLPKFDVIAQLVESGALGTITAVVADNGEWFAADHRIHDRNLAGGPMLDLGTYPVGLAQWLLGTPRRVVAIGQPTSTGVNGQAGLLLEFDGGAQAVLHTTILGGSPTAATVIGSAATLSIDGVFYRPGGFTVAAQDGSWSLRWEEPLSAYDGLAYEAAEIARRITAGERSTPVRPLADTLAMLTIMDEARRQLGASFPDEHSPDEHSPDEHSRGEQLPDGD